jgi:exonuclease VII small subunit
MRFTFHAPYARGIRLIEEIPDVSFCHLEGRNGIGKTLSIRLLELACGRQPYSGAPHAWETLRDQLGETEIGVHGMPEGDVKILLQPANWPPQPLEGLADELGTVSLGGRPATWADLRRLLAVVRIAGDETLTETLARELQQRAVEARQLAKDVRPHVAEWDEVLSRLADLTSRLEPDQLDAMATEAQTARVQADQATERVHAAAAALNQSLRLRAALEGAIRRRDALPDCLSDLEAAAAALDQSGERLDNLNKELQKLTREVGRSQQVRRELAKWERLRSLRDRALSRAIIAEREALRRLNLEDRPRPSELRVLMTEAKQMTNDARAKLRDIDVTGNLQQLTNDLERSLNSAAPAIDDHVVANTVPPITTARLRVGVRGRRTELEGIPRPGEVEELERQADAGVRRLARLQQLKELIAVRVKKQENVEEASAEIQRRLTTVNLSASSQDLLQRIREEQETRVALALNALSAVEQLADLLGTYPVDPRAILGSELPAGLSKELSEEAAAEPSEEPWPETDVVGESRDQPRAPATLTDLTEWRRIAREQDERAATELQARYSDAAAAVLSQAPTDYEALESALSSAVADVEEREAELDSWTQAAHEANELASRTAAILNEVLRRLDDAVRELGPQQGQWPELRSGISALMTSSFTGGRATLDPRILDEAAGATRVSRFASTLAEAARRVRDGLDAVSLILLAEARSLSPRVAAAAGESASALPVDMPGSGRVRRWAESELAELLGEEVLRQELFDGADHLSVDLERARISWRTKDDDRPRVRPLEAFSSGEQVFAYTRARLDLLRTDASPATHKLVVLDEFGAFVARDRFGQLLEFVRDQALGVVADQVLVMLPLARDYTTYSARKELEEEDAPSNGLGTLERIAQVARREYFAVPADPVGV